MKWRSTLSSFPPPISAPQEPESKIPRRGAIAAGKIDTEHSAHA